MESKSGRRKLDQFTKAVTDRRDAAAAVKDFLAKAIESASAPQAAKKENVA